MRLEEMKNNIPETPDFIHKMVQEEVSRQLQDTKVVPMKKRKWNKVQAAAAAALCLLATSTVAYAGNRLYHMYVEKQGNYRVETGIQADAGTSVKLTEQIHDVAISTNYIPVDPSDTTVEEARADILRALKEMNSPLLKGGVLND